MTTVGRPPAPVPEQYVCKYCSEPKRSEEMEVGRKGRPSQSCCKQCGYDGAATWKRNHPEVALADWARRRSKETGLPFNLSHKDISIPDFCPILGIPLVKGDGKQHDGSPTLDRLQPELGYVKGNVVVISYKANRIKNNGNLQDLKAVAAWMESVEKEGCITEVPTLPDPIWRVEGDFGYRMAMRIAEFSEKYCNDNLCWGSLPNGLPRTVLGKVRGRRESS